MLQNVALALLVGFGTAGLVAACGSPVLAQCRIEALAILPPNVDEITVGVARELGRRIHACEQANGDAGVR